MQQIITLKTTILLGAIMLMFSFAFPAFAESKYMPLEEESVTEEEAEQAIADAEEAIDKAEEYIETSTSTKRIKEWEALVVKAETKLAAAEDAFEKEDYSDAEEWADLAENLAKSVYERKSEDKDRGHGNEEDRCDNDNPGKSQDKRCVEDKKEHKKENLGERFKDFGKSSDKDVLNAQIRELLLMLIQLLQAQAKLES